MHSSSFEATLPSASPIRRGLTFIELVVIVLLIGVFILLFAPDSSTVARREIERRAREWTPSADDRIRPDPSLIAPGMGIAGQWESRRHLNSCVLSIEQSSPGVYAVDFGTGGCMGGCKFERNARYRNGILKLDKAVAEYVPAVYDTLYAIRLNGEELLLPAAYVKRFQEACVDGEMRDEVLLRNCVYRRTASPQDDLE